MPWPDSWENFGTVVESYGGKFYYVAVPGQYTYFERDASRLFK